MTGTLMRRAWNAFGRGRARLGLALVWASLSAACATVSPPPKPAPTYAQSPRADSPFALSEDGIRASHGPEASGFMLLERNEDALAWRLALVLEKLRSALRAAKIASTGEPTLSRHNGPMTPWFMRRNEIWLTLDGPER